MLLFSPGNLGSALVKWGLFQGPEGICSKVVKEVHHGDGGHGPIFRILS